MTYEWDEVKARLNIAKHGVSFDEAKSVFGESVVLLFSMKTTRKMKKGFCFWA
ncbi:BrnT family toxin [Campylobacter sp. JMF_04 NA10]|nr:BrnT family toxin [Campylobacter sp. JMF_04 NA10]MDA3077276.1 BrnT family toxin [Campylobacter sp. JMF_04 NA10]